MEESGMENGIRCASIGRLMIGEEATERAREEENRSEIGMKRKG